MDNIILTNNQIEEISKRLDKTKMSNLLLDKKDSQ